MSTGMQIINARSPPRAQNGAARRPAALRQDCWPSGKRSALLDITGGLLFADVADASGGRIAVFCRDGLAALELREISGTKAIAGAGLVRSSGSGQA